MKKLVYLSIIFLIPSSCLQWKKVAIIDEKMVESIEISDRFISKDSAENRLKSLTENQISTFVNKWNNANSLGPVKSMSRYYIIVRLEDGTIRKFKGQGNCLKENDDFGHDIGESEFLESVWKELNKPIIDIKSIFEDYIKHQESTDSKEDKINMSKSLKSITSLSDKDDLELLVNVWMYYDPTDFQDLPEVIRILKSSKPYSIEAIKARISNKKEWESEGIAPFSDLKKFMDQIENK